MERITRCVKCGKLLVPVVAISGRTELQCISCDDPAATWAATWAESPLTAPQSPNVAEPAARH
jgi:phage FluMu protein Com